MRLGLLVLLLGCNDASLSVCGTQRLTVHFPAFALDADQVQIQGTTFPHTSGLATQTYQVALAEGDFTVSALRAGAVVTSAQSTVTKCQDGDADLTFTEAAIRVPLRLKNRVDLLFLVDDSNSMQPKQAELRKRFPQLISLLDQFAASGQPAWYHIGVVTSDLGAGDGGPGGSGCRVGGNGGRLQALGREHALDCMAPAGGMNFIDYNQLDGTSNLPPGQDLATTFGCMAAVGTGGCGFEHQLESVYKALHDCPPGADGSYAGCTIPENRGFLRSDSLLVVVLVTDEDDCSAAPDTDLFDQNKVTTYGPRVSFSRCTRYGIVCGDQLVSDQPSGGPLADCKSAPNLDGSGPGKLFDLGRYVDFFGSQVRSDPNDFILASLAAPAAPFEVVSAQPDGLLCGTTTGFDCQPALQHSCSTSADFFGDPAVRISQLVRSMKNGQETSICDQDYSSALSGVGGFIANNLGVACLPGVVADAVSPACTVRDVSPGGTTTLPVCGQPPCWRAVTNPSCPAHCAEGQAPQQIAAALERGDHQPPPGTVTEISCQIFTRDQTQPPPACP